MREKHSLADLARNLKAARQAEERAGAAFNAAHEEVVMRMSSRKQAEAELKSAIEQMVRSA